MTDVDIVTRNRLNGLAERLREDDPLSVDASVFIKRVISDVEKKIGYQ